ncbi:MAG: GlsB/YeaQ/YmgE family stress response membrane protein [Acidimicrobiia bacterium]
MITFIIGLLLTGLVVGALGRLAIPGPNPMSIGQTILVGIGGALLAGLTVGLLFNRSAGLLSSVLGAALIVWLLERNAAKRAY